MFMKMFGKLFFILYNSLLIINFFYFYYSIVQDIRIEKDESHPGKVLDRRWYERNKHIFPASRWEIYDPSTNREGVRYTIHGDEIH